MAKLGEVCLLKAGKFVSANDISPEYNKGLYPCFGGNGIRGYVADYTHDGEFPLIGRQGALCGNVNLASGKFHATEHAVVVQPKIEMNVHWLYYALNAMNLGQYATGAAQPGLAVSKLETLSIEIPNISEQNKIAQTLYKVEQLVNFRKQQLAKLDELVKARFVEMFGTFPANPFRWSIGKIQDVVSDVRYGSSRPAVEGGKYPYLRMNNITYSGELDLRDTKRIDIPDSELDKCTVRRGDVLFNRTNSKELVGKTCVYNRDELMVLAGFVIRVRINERIRPEVLSAFLNMDFSKRMLIGMCKTAIGQANINAKELQNIDLYIPPIELQDQFVTLKNKIDQQKQTVQQSLEKLELLKKALMQEYFGSLHQSPDGDSHLREGALM